MKVSDIRTGMRVTLRNGETYYAMLNCGLPGMGHCNENNVLVHRVGNSTGWMPLDYYNDNLEYHDQDGDFITDEFNDLESAWDIVKVEAVNYAAALFCNDTYHTIWERSDQA